jgi:hypothetical protein
LDEPVPAAIARPLDGLYIASSKTLPLFGLATTKTGWAVPLANEVELTFCGEREIIPQFLLEAGNNGETIKNGQPYRRHY